MSSSTGRIPVCRQGSGPLYELLVDVERGRSAVGAFTCYDLDTAAGVLDAARLLRAPVVLLVSARALCSSSGAGLVAGIAHLVGSSGVRAVVQLDHLGSIPGASLLSALGKGAVMIDGSAQALSENRDLTSSAVSELAPRGIDVEGELGRLEGDEDRAEGSPPDGGGSTAGARAGGLTDPAQAEQFVEGTGVSCLAVSVGNRHGPYRNPPKLHLHLLAELARRTPAPVALHGASGLSEEDLRRAVAAGAAKVNFNADLRDAVLGAIEDGLADARQTLDLLALKDRVRAGAQRVASQKLAALGWAVPR